MELNKKLRLFSLILNACMLTFLVLAFFMPDYRLFVLLTLVILIVRLTIDSSSQFVLNAKNLLIMSLACALACLAAVGLYLYFFLFSGK